MTTEAQVVRRPGLRLNGACAHLRLIVGDSSAKGLRKTHIILGLRKGKSPLCRLRCVGETSNFRVHSRKHFQTLRFVPAPKFYCLLAFWNSFGEVMFGREKTAEVEVVIRRIGLKGNGLPQLLDTLIELACAGEDDTEHVVRIGEIWVKLQRPLDVLNRFVRLSDLQ
jgi:hypothetical protein